ncbi:hypothetical protein PsAD37_03014 [Pseudovibrio sp. Ad37]|nr:hypothetical protein PsAD37_03014 [Pseudovibrio sp. Ad37]KZL27663.1 hypothetical protein PsWM33_00857 [Pseudovibrio sp. WM33]
MLKGGLQQGQSGLYLFAKIVFLQFIRFRHLTSIRVQTKTGPKAELWGLFL